MASREWDAYRSLNLTSRDSHGMTCVGMTRYGKRCRWDISEASYSKIRALLDAMEGRPPSEAIRSLQELVELSLCRDYHQHQADDGIDQWENAIMEAAEEYENGMGLRRKIHVLKENLGKEEAKTEGLQKKVEELQARARNQAGLRELQAEIERLRVQLSNEQMNSALLRIQWKTTRLRCEDHEKQIEKYRRAFLESERKVGKLEEENTEISRQLVADKEALEFATRQCEEISATSSELRNKLSVQSIEYQQSISQKAQTIERTTAERDNLRAEVATLESQLSQLNEQSIQMGQEIDRATTEELNLSIQVENLTRELDLESKTSSKSQSDLFQTRTRRDTLSKEVDGLRSQLTTLNNKEIVVQSQLESEYQKSEALTAKLSQLKNDQTTLSIETETLQIELASKHKTSARLHQELNTIKEDLFTTKLALGDTQASLENYQRGNDELKTSAFEREKENSALITTLTDQIDFFKSHPFKTFFMSLIDTFQRWSKAVVEYTWSVRSTKRILGASNPEGSCSA